MSRPLLILDLDETLVYATKRKLPVECDFRCSDYFVFKRPYVDEFIAECAKHYELAAWTSSTANYASCIEANLFGESPLSFLWARDRCTRRFDSDLQEHYWVKDLKKVKRAGYDLRRVLFVDNTPLKLQRHYGNVVVVGDFLGDPEDDELEYLVGYLVKVVGEEDYRAIEKRGWRSAI